MHTLVTIQPKTRLNSIDLYIANLCPGIWCIGQIGGVYTMIYGKLGKIVVGFMLCTHIDYDSAKN